MNKSILITGFCGYVGATLIEYLRNKYPNYNLHGYDNGYFKRNLVNENDIPEFWINDNYGDIRDINSNHLKNIDTIIYLSAVSNDPMGVEFENATKEINFKACINLAQMAKEMGVKNFIFASSCSVYGFVPEGEEATELSIVHPLTVYAQSKVDAENQLWSLADENFKVTCLRFATACGMSNRLRLDLVLNDFVYQAVSSRKIKIQSDGTPNRPLIDVIDMARAIDWAIHREGVDNLVVNVGRWNYTVKDIATAVQRMLPDIEIEINENAQPDKRSYKVNFDLFHSLAPEYIPQVSLEESISNLINGLRTNYIRDHEDLIRLKALNKLKANNQINADLWWK